MPPPSMLLTQHNFCTLCHWHHQLLFVLCATGTISYFLYFGATGTIGYFLFFGLTGTIGYFLYFGLTGTIGYFLYFGASDTFRFTGLSSRNGYAGRHAALPQCRSDALLKWVLHVSG